MKKLGTLLLTLVLGLSLVGCGGTDDKKGDSTTGTQVSGKVSLNGSTSMEKLMNGLKEAIVEVHPQLLLEPQFTGSSAGVEAVLNKTADIGNSSRGLKDEEKAKGLVENIVAIDGIAIVTDKENSVASLTKDQLAKIYTGEIKNWKEVGGADQNIVVVGREAGSGTRGSFEEILDIKNKCKYANEMNETGAVVAKASSTPGAIGYVSLDNITDAVKALDIDGVKASEATISDGSYTLQRPFVMATNGEISTQNDQVKAVFEFLNSEEGQTIIKAVGLVIPKK